MKKTYFILFTFLIFSCTEQPIPSTTGEIVIEKMRDTKEFLLESPKVTSISSIVLFVNGTIKSDVSIKVYDSTGNRLITESIIPKGTYFYSTREFRLDYYEANDILLKIKPASGSEETFNLKWGII